MARLQIKTPALENPSIHLRLGKNRIGRSPLVDFQINHPTISGQHCELILIDDKVVLRDLGSTNGTFVNGERVTEAILVAGQTIHLADVELSVEDINVTVSIPKNWNQAITAAPIAMRSESGVACCPRHEDRPATHQCTECKEVMCEKCVHRLRRRGGKITLLLCPTCSSVVESLDNAPHEKKSLISKLVKLGKSTITHAVRKLFEV
jgi:hypothetical protein